jgi:hypothetical protein
MTREEFVIQMTGLVGEVVKCIGQGYPRPDEYYIPKNHNLIEINRDSIDSLKSKYIQSIVPNYYLQIGDMVKLVDDSGTGISDDPRSKFYQNQQYNVPNPINPSGIYVVSDFVTDYVGNIYCIIKPYEFVSANTNISLSKMVYRSSIYFTSNNLVHFIRINS